MNIEDVKVGMKVKLISTANTEKHLGYDEEDMLSVGETGTVADIITDDVEPSHVLLEGGDYYDIRDLESVEDVKEKSIGNLTVSISTEDKQEIAKDILKIILEDLNSVITGAIQSLSEVDRGEVGKGVDSADVIGFADTYDMSDEKMHKLLDEVIKEIFKEQLLEVTKQFNK